MKLHLLPMFLFALVPLSAQSTPAAPVYVESFRHGETHVVEDGLDVKLTPQDFSYRERIKDSHGDDRYVFTILPRMPEGDTEITSWQARLTDLRHPIYSNILLTSPQPSDDPKNAYKDTLWRLEPSGFAPVPIGAKRIIKVDGFYVVLQVKAYHFTPPDSPYLDSMTVAVQFTNTDPRAPDASQK
ncbi:MAG: hypothetical protein WAM78_14010 [Candidatus Sulfotelmatobacter sp.]